MLKEIVVLFSAEKLMVLEKAAEELGEFTGAFKEQEWEQSLYNMLILQRGSFYQ